MLTRPLAFQHRPQQLLALQAPMACRATVWRTGLAPLGIRRGEPGSTSMHSEVRQFYGVVNAAKGLPERVKLPPAPKAPAPPSGIAAGAADALGSALGMETPHQRAQKAHAGAVEQWREPSGNCASRTPKHGSA